jgi:hypothetical protein
VFRPLPPKRAFWLLSSARLGLNSSGYGLILLAFRSFFSAAGSISRLAIVWRGELVLRSIRDQIGGVFGTGSAAGLARVGKRNPGVMRSSGNLLPRSRSGFWLWGLFARR